MIYIAIIHFLFARKPLIGMIYLFLNISYVTKQILD